VAFWVHLLKTFGITEKSNMKMVKNFELLVKEIFELRVLENSSSNP